MAFKSKNPFLERMAAGGKNTHGRKSEKRVAKTMGARLHPNSGAMRGAKSDASLTTENFRLEMKSTRTSVMALDMGWLSKISEEAVTHGQRPAVVVSFVDHQGVPRMRHHHEWVVLPLSVFKELTTK